jgi:hypothetical protein
MKEAESALRACSSETFARTLTSPRPMTHTEALAWLDTAASLLGAFPAKSTSAGSGLILKVSEAEAIGSQTTGTGGDDE